MPNNILCITYIKTWFLSCKFWFWVKKSTSQGLGTPIFHNFVFLLKRVGWFITFTVSSNCCFYLSIGDHSFQLSTFLRWEGSQSCQICNQIVVKKCLNLSSFYKWHFKKYFTPLCEKNILAFCGCTILKSLFVRYIGVKTLLVFCLNIYKLHINCRRNVTQSSDAKVCS